MNPAFSHLQDKFGTRWGYSVESVGHLNPVDKLTGILLSVDFTLRLQRIIINAQVLRLTNCDLCGL
jgi:hypothetical protein